MSVYETKKMWIGSLFQLKKNKVNDPLLYFDEFYSPLVVFAQRVIGTQSIMAEKFVVDCYVNLLEKKTAFKSIHEVRQYLFDTVGLDCTNYLITQAVLNGGKEAGREQRARNEKINLEELQTEVLLWHSIYSEIDSLPSPCREVYKLSLFDKLDNRQIACLLNMPLVKVGWYKLLAFCLLRTMFLKKIFLTVPSILYFTQSSL